ASMRTHGRRHAEGAAALLPWRAVLSRLLADVVAVVHLAYLAFIPVGGFLCWRWRRLIPFHLSAIPVPAMSVTIGFECPLTTLENALRRRGGEPAYRGGFVDHYLTGKVYPSGHDTAVQLVIGAVVVVSYAGLFVRWRRERRGLGSTQLGYRERS